MSLRKNTFRNLKFKNSADVEMDIFARFLIAALQTGCNIIPVVAPGFKWPRPDTLPEDISPICHMNGIKWKFGLQVNTSKYRWLSLKNILASNYR